MTVHLDLLLLLISAAKDTGLNAEVHGVSLFGDTNVMRQDRPVRVVCCSLENLSIRLLLVRLHIIFINCSTRPAHSLTTFCALSVGTLFATPWKNLQALARDCLDGVFGMSSVCQRST